MTTDDLKLTTGDMGESADSAPTVYYTRCPVRWVTDVVPPPRGRRVGW